MTDTYLSVLGVSVAFLGLATGLAAFSPRLGTRPVGANLWKKYPIFLLLNLLFIAGCWLPREWHVLTALLALLGGLAAWELARALLPAGRAPLVIALLCAGLIAAADALPDGALFKVWLAVGLGSVLAATLAPGRDRLGRRLLALAGGLVYLPLCLAAYVLVRRGEVGGFHSLFFYLIIAANDAFAQIIGKMVGRRPLAPRLSPSKTVEGAMGGLLVAGLAGAALGPVVGWGWLGGAAAGLIVALAGSVGDLVESAWKRALGIKDFSTLLGAHGGVLDRFDSLILAAPVYFLLVSLAGR